MKKNLKVLLAVIVIVLAVVTAGSVSYRITTKIIAEKLVSSMFGNEGQEVIGPSVEDDRPVEGSQTPSGNEDNSEIKPNLSTKAPLDALTPDVEQADKIIKSGELPKIKGKSISDMSEEDTKIVMDILFSKLSGSQIARLMELWRQGVNDLSTAEAKKILKGSLSKEDINTLVGIYQKYN